MPANQQSALALAHEAIDRLNTHGDHGGSFCQVCHDIKEAHAALEEAVKRAEMRGRLAAVTALRRSEEDE
jgi:hypothetical protein